MNIFKRWAAWGVVGVGLVFGACATSPEPFEYQPENELKSGPGMFSGDDGVFTLYGRPAAPSTEGEEGQRREADPSEAIAPDTP